MNYKKEINELLKKGYAFKVPNESLNIKDPKLWFLPHFAIKNPNKPNKTRVVFDAAAKVNGYSLNDYMLPGPDWLSSLVGILIRFREHKVAFSADIKEMFNRINIIDEDCSAQSFLWRDLKINEKPKVYRMKAMLFGMTSSPFLAQFVKNLNAKKYESTMPRAVESIVRNHYVDDCLDGAKSEDEAVKLIEQIVKIHKEGGFELRGFTCNCQEVLDQLPKELVNTNTITSLEQEQRILGLLWNSKEDHFKFNLKFHKVSSAVLNGIKIPTKREVLKVVMSIFDPLGFTSPVTIKGKILLQEIWRSGLGWDDEITSQMSDKWKQWWKELKFLTLLEIPRCYSTTDNYDNVDLHVFTDASEEAYAAAAYLCFSSANERRLILIAAKARVAPLKTLTIPRLELMAAVLGCRLSDTIVKELSCKIQQKYFWCDSKTILNWIKTEKRLPSFVASRVGEIIETTTVEDWRWIPSTENVADVCTRSKPITDENIWDDWLYGPKFLYTNKNDWTFDKEKYKDDDTNTGPITENVLVVIEQNSYMPKVKCLYHWNRIRRITAWMKRFIDNSKLKDEDTLKRKYGCLEVKEIEWAEKQCIKFAQKESFPVDMMNLQKNELNKGGRLVKLSPKLNEDGIIQLAGRIDKAKDIDYQTKQPVILDGKHPYVKLLILHYHKEAGHQGVETVLNELRKKFWILNARSCLKKVSHQCFVCRKRVSQPIQPIMGPLPSERFTTFEKPFTAAGVDYFGPFLVKHGRKLEKRYGVLFTCLTTRAIHVEVAHSLDIDSCIMALRRMMARRGKIKVLWSDNGTNLRGANRELIKAFEELDNEEMKGKMANRGIDWRFIPPETPHMGGAWERLIGTFKRAIEAVLKDRHVKDEVLSTVFAEAEYIVNSRPLTHVSSDYKDPVCITPNDILIGPDNITIPGVFTKYDEVLRKQWRVA